MLTRRRFKREPRTRTGSTHFKHSLIAHKGKLENVKVKKKKFLGFDVAATCRGARCKNV